MSSSLALDHLASGKVRELYDAGDDRLLLVASDRISAFDVVLPTPIPDKGRVLTALSLHWFALHRRHRAQPRASRPALSEFPEGARDPELAGRALLVRRLEMLPLECVVRGYLAGSGWKDYGRTGAVCGIPLPTGLREADRLPRTLFTPSTKADRAGTTRTSPPSRASRSSASERYREVERVSIALYERAAAAALARGIILADTKFEFGLDARRLAGRRRRGADARLVALLAGRQLRARHPRRRPSTSSTCATGWRRSRLGQDARPGPSCPTRCATARPRATARPTSDSPGGRSRPTSTRWGCAA